MPALYGIGEVGITQPLIESAVHLIESGIID
jgi:hypothetical protein